MDNLDKQEAMEKGADPEVKLGDGELRIGEDEEKDVGMDTVSTEEIEWKDKDRASATLLKLSPESVDRPNPEWAPFLRPSCARPLTGPRIASAGYLPSRLLRSTSPRLAA
jgi:hypothetical protein